MILLIAANDFGFLPFLFPRNNLANAKLTCDIGTYRINNKL